MKKISLMATLPALALMAACATETPYGPSQDGGGYGFSEQRIEDNRYRITFRGNSLTPRETVENYLLYRAAEKTVSSGNDYFVVVSDDTEKTTTYRTTSRPDPYYYRPFPYYAYGYRWARPYDDVDIRESTRYAAVAYVVMYKGEKPNDPAAYDARQVKANLEGFIRREEAQ